MLRKIITAGLSFLVLWGESMADRLHLEYLNINNQDALLENIERFAAIRILDNGYVYGQVNDNGSLEQIKAGIENKYGVFLKTISVEIGPHVSVQYDDERLDNQTRLRNYDSFNFTPTKIARVILHGKTYCVILVKSPEIEQQRISMGLSASPIYKNIQVSFHITIGEEIFTKKFERSQNP